MMKKMIFMALAAFVLVGCSESEEREVMNEESAKVTLTFSPYEQTEMTRAAVSIANVVSQLDVWITGGATPIDLHQSTADADFGSISVTLDKTKEYTIYAIGHKCTSAATLTDSIISFPEDKVTHSMFYKTIFKPDTVTTLSCEMKRIVSQFRLETADTIPDDCKKMRFTVKNVYNQWHITKGGVNEIDRVSTVNIKSRNADKTATFSIYTIVTDTKTNHDITIEALNETDSVLQTKHLQSVPLRNGYKITYRGEIFTDKVAAAGFFVDADLLDDGTVTF